MAIPFLQFSLKNQAFDWLAPKEANVNNNNSLVAPIRGLLFGGKLEERNCHHPAPHQTSNHAQLVQRKSRMVLYRKASSPWPKHDMVLVNSGGLRVFVDQIAFKHKVHFTTTNISWNKDMHDCTNQWVPCVQYDDPIDVTMHKKRSHNLNKVTLSYNNYQQETRHWM